MKRFGPISGYPQFNVTKKRKRLIGPFPLNRKGSENELRNLVILFFINLYNYIKFFYVPIFTSGFHNLFAVVFFYVCMFLMHVHTFINFLFYEYEHSYAHILTKSQEKE